MTDQRHSAEAEALTWLVRVNDPEFGDWDGWEAWLAEDPRHAEAYWRLAEREADLVESLAPSGSRLRAPVPASTIAPFPRPSRRRWLAAGIGVAAAVVAGVWIAWPASQTWSVQTAPGETRSLTLADGSLLHLDGATRLDMDRRDPRAVTLVSGRALFEVRHDAADPFVVSVGDATVTDLGTVFDITRLQDGTRVGVSEGVVRFDGSGQSQTLQAGEGLTAIDGVVVRRSTASDMVTGWRGGRLTYQDEPLAIVAQDLARATGRAVTVDDSLAARAFTGSLDTSGSPEDLQARLERLLDVAVVRDGEGWRLQSRPGA